MLTSTRKTRVGVSRLRPSGQHRKVARQKRGYAPSCATGGYKLASGQASFISRDPAEEKGGLHLYGFCGNDGINHYDVLGLKRIPSSGKTTFAPIDGGWRTVSNRDTEDIGGAPDDPYRSPGPGYGTWGHGKYGPGYYNDPADMWSPFTLDTNLTSAGNPFYFGIGQAAPGGAAPARGLGLLGANGANNTFPYMQSTDSACSVNAVRNLEWLFTMGYGVGGTGIRSEREIAIAMANRIGRANAFANGGGGIGRDDPFIAPLNAGLNPVGLQMGQAVQYNGVTGMTSILASAATNGTAFVVKTNLNPMVGSSGAANSRLGANHVIVFSPYFGMDPNGQFILDQNGQRVVMVRVYDSGTPDIGGGNATVHELTVWDAMTIPTHVRSSIGVQGNLYPVTRVVPNQDPEG